MIHPPIRSVWRIHVPRLGAAVSTMQISCQVKNAKMCCRFRTASICSGAISSQPLPHQRFSRRLPVTLPLLDFRFI